MTGRCLLALAMASLLAACANTGSPTAATRPAGLELMQAHPERLIVVAVANPRARIVTQAGSTLASYATAPRYATGNEARSTLEDLADEHGLTPVAAWPISALRLHCEVLEIPPTSSRDDVVARLAHDKRVAIAQPLQSFDTLANPVPPAYNDPYAPLQRGLADLDAAAAHRVSRGEGSTIAIIDTGVASAHPDLKDRIASTRNFVDADTAQFERDRHGTEVAGVMAAVANNAQGIVGIAPAARLAVYKACWQAAPRAGARCNSFTLAQAISASLDDGARIINLSLGGPEDPLLDRLLTHAIAQGRIVIAAMPRDGKPAGFPSGVPGVIVVESAGPPHRHTALQAPGRDILTLEPGGGYDFQSGSSLAAAHVSGVVALMLAARHDLSAVRVNELLQRSQAPVADGISVSACAAVAGLRPGVSCTPSVAPSQAHAQPAPQGAH